MPQQTLNPVNDYGRSGGVLLVNPTDRLSPIVYGQSARDLRSPAVIRGTPPAYAPQAPAALTTVAPATGLAAGGLAVTLTGTGFTEATGVLFGGTAATSVVVASATSITCVTPAHAAGTVAVVVQDPSGDGTKPAGFIYT